MKGGRAVAFHSSGSALLSNTSQSDSSYPLLCSSHNKNSDNNNDDNNYNDSKNNDNSNNNNDNDSSSRDSDLFNSHESSEERGLVERIFNTNLIIHNSDWKPYNDPETGSVFW